MPRAIEIKTSLTKPVKVDISIFHREVMLLSLTPNNRTYVFTVSATEAGQALVETPTFNGFYAIEPADLDSLTEGRLYYYNLWDVTDVDDKIVVAYGRFKTANSIAPALDGGAVTLVPTSSGGLADQTFTQNTGNQTVNAAAYFLNATGGTWSVTGAGATIDQTGLLTLSTIDLRTASIVTVTYTNIAGSASSAFNVTVNEAVVTPAVISIVSDPVIAPIDTSQTLAARTTQGSYTADTGGITVVTTWKDGSGNALTGGQALTEGLVVIAVDTVTASTGGTVLVNESAPVTVTAAATGPVTATSSVPGLTISLDAGTATVSGDVNYNGTYAYSEADLASGRPTLVKPVAISSVDLAPGTRYSFLYDLSVYPIEDDLGNPVATPTYTKRLEDNEGNLIGTGDTVDVFDGDLLKQLLYKGVAQNQFGTTNAPAIEAQAAAPYAQNMVTFAGDSRLFANDYRSASPVTKGTLSWWAKYTAAPDFTTLGFVGGMFVLARNGTYRLEIRDSLNALAYNQLMTIARVLNVKQHMQVNFDFPNNVAQFYINGVLQTGTPSTDNLLGSTGFLNTGQVHALPQTGVVTGSTADFIWSPNTIIPVADLYNGGVPPDPVQVAPTATIIVGGTMKADADIFGNAARGWNDRYNLKGELLATRTGTALVDVV